MSYCDLCSGSCPENYCRNKWLRCHHCDYKNHEDHFMWRNKRDVCARSTGYGCYYKYATCDLCDKEVWVGSDTREYYEDWDGRWKYRPGKHICDSCNKVKERLGL